MRTELVLASSHPKPSVLGASPAAALREPEGCGSSPVRRCEDFWRSAAPLGKALLPERHASAVSRAAHRAELFRLKQFMTPLWMIAWSVSYICVSSCWLHSCLPACFCFFGWHCSLHLGCLPGRVPGRSCGCACGCVLVHFPLPLLC